MRSFPPPAVLLRTLSTLFLIAAAGCGDSTGGNAGPGTGPPGGPIPPPDTTAPMISLITRDTVVREGELRLAGTIIDDQGIVQFTVLSGEGTVLLSIRPPAPNTLFAFDYPLGTGEGRSRLRVVAEDQARNTSFKEVTLVVDRTPPELYLLGPSFGPGGTAALVAAVEDRAGSWDEGRVERMTVQVDGGPEAQAPGSFGAAAIAAIPVTLPAGGATFRAWAYDHAGNRASVDHRYAAAPAFTSLSVSGIHSCALTADGAAYCWGSNGLAELGTGVVGGESATPVAVAGGHRFRAISTGSRHSCGIALDGAAWCWGMLEPDRVGVPHAATAPAPVRVPGGGGFRSLSAGSYHTCALDADGAAWCWGAGSQLGQGAFAEWSDTPVRVQGGHLFRSVSAGSAFTCGVTLAGKGYCWGDNRQGQLGDGTNEHRLLPTAVGGALEWKEIDAGVEHACGIAASGRAYCWGSDFNGGLGGAEIVAARSLPSLVDWPGTFRSISASSYACGLTTDGQLVCWGGLDPNRLGIPGHRTSNFGRPTLGMGGLTFSSVSTGRGTCALTGSGITYCFGTNDF